MRVYDADSLCSDKVHENFCHDFGKPMLQTLSGGEESLGVKNENGGGLKTARREPLLGVGAGLPQVLLTTKPQPFGRERGRSLQLPLQQTGLGRKGDGMEGVADVA